MNAMDGNGRFVFMYVGSYTRKSDVGLTVFRLDLETGETQPIQTVNSIKNASFLTTDLRTRRLYSVSEVQETKGKLGGEIVSYQLDTASGRLNELNRQLSLGKDPCYVSLLYGTEPSRLFVTNYSSGNVSVFPLTAEGDLLEPASQLIAHEGASQATPRQLETHTHSVVVHPGGEYVVVSDLGMDKLVVYRWDAELEQLISHTETATAKGAGPRHFAFHPDLPYAYGINELDNTITAYAFDAKAGSLTALQSVPALPADFSEENTTADLHIEPTGRFLYGSNRGHNSIVVYRVNAESGKLTYVEHTSTYGLTPRNFAIAPGGKLLLAANQQSDTIEMYHLDSDSGKLMHDAGRSITVSEPVCIHIV